MNIQVIIPAFNEADSIHKVVGDIPTELVKEVIVVSNGSTDETEERAKTAGATVLREEQKGYGFACLKGMSYIAAKAKSEQPDIVVFLDGDYSDYPEEMKDLIKPIIEEDYDLVIGSRALGERERGSMQPQQIFGNWLATTLIKLLYKVKFSDLGPFRAIKYEKLLAIDMKDTTYGWTVEMQVKAAKLKMKCTEVAVNYRQRIGVSKITGTIKGTILAGYKILWTIFKLL
ncbi:MAG: glycosyltransferase family 2 protein [Bacteroidia bacterium]|nr:glycosyltransferase family 2 protein [Bacteroidia bacterium]